VLFSIYAQFFGIFYSKIKHKSWTAVSNLLNVERRPVRPKGIGMCSFELCCIYYKVKMSNAETDYYANLLCEILNKLSHKMPVAFYPEYDSMCLDFSRFESAGENEKYEIYKDVIENDV
jgi:hypothetical protein